MAETKRSGPSSKPKPPARKSERKPDDPEQSERFKEAARTHEADDASGAFERTVLGVFKRKNQ
jgi:hypothetical protein